MSASGGPSTCVWSTGQCAALACLLEASAPKAGNVHPGASFADMTYLDFVMSAVVVAPAFEHAAERGVGPTVLAAIRKRRAVTPVNTNLGTVLLLAPMAVVPRDRPLSAGIRDVLAVLTVADAADTYEAIRLAAAGGLGRVESQDVAAPPTCTLREAMALAADRDIVARQYTNDFAEVFKTALPAFRDVLADGASLRDAIVRMHLVLMATHPDSLMARKCGIDVAKEASRRASALLAAGFSDEAAKDRFAAFDEWLRADGHQRNPGSTADLVAAALFAALREGIIPLTSTIQSARFED